MKIVLAIRENISTKEKENVRAADLRGRARRRTYALPNCRNKQRILRRRNVYNIIVE